MRFLKRFTIKNKLIITLVPVILLTFLIFLLTVYFISFRETQRIVNEQADTNIDQKILLMDNYLGKLRMETEIFMFDENVQKRLRVKKTGASPEKIDELQLDFKRDMYNMLISYDVNVETISMKTLNSDFYYWKMDNRIDHQELRYRLLQNEEKARELGGGIYYSYEKLEKGLVTMHRLIKDPVRDVELGVLMIDFNLNFLTAVGDSSYNPSAIPTVVITNPQNTIVFNSSPLENEAVAHLNDMQNIRLNGGDYRISYRNSGESDWKVMLVVNETLLYRNIYRLAFFQVALVAVSVIAVMLIIFLVSKTISGQFGNFIKTISHTTNPKDHDLVTVDSDDEFKNLAEVYNQMILRIDNLIDEVYAKELLLKNAELKSFQAQINPHFLYNTLECINGLVDVNRPGDIKKTVTSLANIMRMSIKGKELLTVRENNKYIQEYMYIEKIRYGDKILFLTEMPESIMEYLIPKLILQPLIENSIVHGVSDILGQGMIGMFGREEEDCITFTVRDNGKGIPGEVIEYIESHTFSPSDSDNINTESIGLRNIQSRIRLMYGENYGLSIQNPPEGGSCIQVRLPKIEQS